MIFALSDVVWQAVIGAVVTIVLAWFQMRTRATIKKTADDAAVKVEEVKKNTQKAAVKVEEVKETLQTTSMATSNKLEAIAKMGESIHTLVNSNMLAQLKISMVALSRVADVTNDPKDRAAAELAEKLYREHEMK